MKQMKIAVPAITFILVFFVVTIMVAQMLGVPLWWLFRGLVPSSVIGPNDTLNVVVNPEVPSVISQTVTVTVTNASDKIPVIDATVSVYKDSGFICDFYTDNKGESIISYLGPVTIIKVSKDGYQSSMEAIPNSPDEYVQNQNNAIIGGLISGIPSVILTIFLQKKLAAQKPTRKKRKTSKKVPIQK
jgi:hypothetical protein